MQTHLNAAGSTLLKTGQCRLESLSVNTGAAGSLTIYDGTDGTGAVVAVVDTTTAKSLNPAWMAHVGLYVTQVGAADLTLVWR
jgi:hypothetical protein